MNQFSVRMFANAAVIEKSIQKLTKALDKEIKYENENYSQLEDIETFLNESGFKFSEEDHGTTMVLTKTVGDKTVEVHFEARYVLIYILVVIRGNVFVDISFLLSMCG